MNKVIISVFLISTFIFTNLNLYQRTMSKQLSSSDHKSDRIIVSLGDSYSSGEGIEPFYGQYNEYGMDVPFSQKVENDDWIAHRSAKAWSGMLHLAGVDGIMAENKGENWYFAAVSGAETINIKHTKELSDTERDRAKELLQKNKLNKTEEKELESFGYQKKEYKGSGTKGTRWLEPQLDVFDKLGDKKADYVTITIGGNDLGFADIITQVVKGINYIDKTELWSMLYEAKMKIRENGEMAKALEKTYLKVSEIAGPQATVIVVGYPRLFEKSGKGTFVSWIEAELVNEAVDEFDKMINKLVSKCDSMKSDDAKLEYVSVIEAFRDHEAYSDYPYINSVIFGRCSEDIKSGVASAYSMHPNLNGARTYADCVQEKIDSLDKGYIDQSTINAYKDGYKKILKDNKNRIEDYINMFKTGEDTDTVALYDINGDAIPELLFISSDNDLLLSVYTYDENGAKKLGEYNLPIMTKSIAYCILGTGYSSELFIYYSNINDFTDEKYEIYHLKNGSMDFETSACIENVYGPDGVTKIYKYQDVEVSEIEYKKLKNTLHKWGETIICNKNFLMNNLVPGSEDYSYTYDEAIKILTDK